MSKVHQKKGLPTLLTHKGAGSADIDPLHVQFHAKCVTQKGPSKLIKFINPTHVIE